MKWVYLLLAIVSEVVATSALKSSSRSAGCSRQVLTVWQVWRSSSTL